LDPVVNKQYEWYVDTILQLISAAGDHVGAEVWYRVVQLVTNNEDLQPYAAGAVFRHLQSSACHENMIKVGGELPHFRLCGKADIQGTFSESSGT
jgi:hypothetical protein